MKKRFLITLFLILILVSNISLASYDTVTMTVVEEPVCTMEIGESSKFEKKLVEKNLNQKEVTLQLQVTNEEAALQPTGEVMLVIDNSQSMEEIVEGTTTREDLVIESASTLVNTILSGNDNLQVGVVSFSTNADVSKEGTIEDASLVSNLSSDPQALVSAISNIQYTGPRTDLQAGLNLASQYFTETDNNKYIIVLTDGVPNVALDYDGMYFSDDVINKTRNELISLATSGYDVITMLTGISNPDATPGTRQDDKTYANIIEEVFGTETTPTAGTFYYIQDSEIEQTITNDIYNDLLPIDQVITDIVVTDYFPQEIIDNFEFAYVAQPNIGTISADVDTTNNSITWTISELQPGETATVQYTLSLKRDFDSSIVGEILDTNEKVDLAYTDFNGKTVEDTSDVTPKLKLTEPPVVLPAAGTSIVIALFVIVVAGIIYSFIRFNIINKSMKH